jgi:hypothetical protein
MQERAKKNSAGSLAEAEYLFSFAKRLGYLKGDASQIEILLERTGTRVRLVYCKLVAAVDSGHEMQLLLCSGRTTH